MQLKNKFIDLTEECRVKFQESYEEEFGGNAKVITVFSEANTVVTFYISVRGDYRHFEDALRFHSDQIMEMRSYAQCYYAQCYARLYHKEIKERGGGLRNE